MSLIALGQGQPTKIANELGLSRPAISRQLRHLHKAGLISRRRHYMDHRGWRYFIEPRLLGQITAWLAGTEVGRVIETNRQREGWMRALLNLEVKEPESGDSEGTNPSAQRTSSP